MVHREFIVARETCLAWLVGVRCCYLVQAVFSWLHWNKPWWVTWNLTWSCLSINVILLVYIYDENVFVMSSCCDGCEILVGSRMTGCSSWYGGCQILTGSEMQPENRQVTVGVAYVSVTGVIEENLKNWLVPASFRKLLTSMPTM
jgi:hypothetical protein